MSSEPYRIDVHHHILPPVYVSGLNRAGITSSGGRPIPEWDLQSTLALMDRHAITTAITSISEPGIYFGDKAFTIDLAHRCNEFSAQLIRDYPQRFGAFAILPLPDIDAALKELEYALDTLKLDGVVLLSSVDGKYPGDPLFDELFTELNRRKSVIFLHPTDPTINSALKLDLPSF